MEIRIENATRNDYPEFADVHGRFTYVASTEARGPIVNQEQFNEYVDAGSMFAAFEGEKMIGYAIVSAYEDGTCDINEIFVLPEYQHKGVGKAIVQKIVEEAKASELTKLKVFSVFMETDSFWMRKCLFAPDEDGYLILNIN